MPKRSRTSHIPAQIRRRKPRRTADFNDALPSQIPVTEDAGTPVTASTATAATAIAEPRIGRRMAAATRSRETYSGRQVPGQLPTFERSYLVRELRQITLISGSLLLVLILLWVLMR